MKKPMFLLRKFRWLSKKNKKDWIKVIESVTNSEKKKAISAYLQWNLKKAPWMDLPCYSNPVVQDDFRPLLVRVSRPYCTKKCQHVGCSEVRKSLRSSDPYPYTTPRTPHS